MRTLAVTAKIGESISGYAAMGQRFASVQVGKMAPLLRKSEDAEAILRTGFLDAGVPLELNLLHARLIRGVLRRLAPLAITQEGWNHPDPLLHTRPLLSYVPPETLTYANEPGLKALGNTGSTGQEVAHLRSSLSDAAFWTELASRKLYDKWVRELLRVGSELDISLFAPPVPPVTRDLPAAADRQADVNVAALGFIPKPPIALHPVGPLYSLHVHPNALLETDLMNRALAGLSRSISEADNPYWGVHLHFTDISLAAEGGAGRVEAARALISEVSRIAQGSYMFTVVSDAGPIGPVALDYGASFATYHTGMTMHRAYVEGGPDDVDLQAGKTLGVWDYNLRGRKELGRRGWKVDDNGYTPREVPIPLRTGSPKTYRVEFGKPNNIGTAERINVLREKELNSGKNARPGLTHVGKSSDRLIAPWAGT